MKKIFLKLKQKMDPRIVLSRRRIRWAELASIAVCIAFVSVFGIKYLLLPAVNAEYKAEKNEVTWNAVKDYAIEGSYYDRRGNVIMSAGSSEAPMNEDYAYLLGYYTVNSGKENMYGLRGNLKEYTLYHLDETNTGASVVLTTDNNLMNFCTGMLGGNEGSITVIDNATGAILALASQSDITYDVNDMQSFITSTVPESQFRRGTYETDPPGSTFKVITAAAALQYAKEDNLPSSFFDYNDTGEFIPEGSDYAIHNAEDKVYGAVNLETALNNSVNCYFANLGIQTGADRLTKMAENFLIGKDIEIPFLDTLHSSFDLGEKTPILIAQTSYGQGNTQITPVHLALICSAIANNGKMKAPYIVDHIDSGKMPLYHHIEHTLASCVDADIADSLKQIMHSTAVGYGLNEQQYGMWYAKTGTAECPNNRIHSYLMGFNDRYSFCISENNTSSSALLWTTACSLADYLNQMN